MRRSAAWWVPLLVLGCNDFDSLARAPFAWDRFDRAVGTGWGVADAGGPWTVSSASMTKVAGGSGLIYGFVSPNDDVNATIGPVRSDLDVIAAVTVTAPNPGGTGYSARVVARAQADARDGYSALIDHDSSGALAWRLQRAVNAGGTDTLELASGTLLASGGAGTRWWIRVRARGDRVMARFWRDGTAEPDAWTAQTTDGYFASGKASVGTLLFIGALVPYPQTGFSDFAATDLGP
jgi:hypothetical protein